MKLFNLGKDQEKKEQAPKQDKRELVPKQDKKEQVSKPEKREQVSKPEKPAGAEEVDFFSADFGGTKSFFPKSSETELSSGSTDFGIKYPKVFLPKNLYKETYKEMKLLVILLENTAMVMQEKEKVEKIVSSLLTTDYICIIRYGSQVSVEPRAEVKEWINKNVFDEEHIEEKACLFDALLALEKVVSDNAGKVEVVESKRMKIQNIEIVGIGRCVDNASLSSLKMAMESFYRTVKHPNITSKYFSLNEAGFVQAASIGFHSIGAINRNYE